MPIKTGKSFYYTKIPQKTENLSKMVQSAIFGAFCSQLRHWSPFLKTQSSFELIWVEGSVIRSKSLSYTKIPQKPEDLSKMVRGEIFGTFCSQY